MNGKLFLTATPIGNLEDMTFRAIRVMKEADLIAAEDTRRTMKLLTHFDIHTPLTSYYEQNKLQKAPHLLSLLKEGKQIVLVSDAGTPGISDPGEDLVRKAIEIGVDVIPVPGPTAFIAALTASGLSTERFIFMGFLPRKSKELNADLELIKNEQNSVVIYEAPHRILNTLQAFLEHFPDRKIVAAREITKIHEEFIRGTVRDVYQHFLVHTPKGEFCLVLEGATPGAPIDVEDLYIEAEKHYSEVVNSGISKKEAVKKTAQKFGLSKNTLYQRLIAEKEAR